MKKGIKKLQLHRETLRHLDSGNAGQVAGGQGAGTETGSPPECIENTLVTNEGGGFGGGTEPSGFNACTVASIPACGPQITGMC